MDEDNLIEVISFENDEGEEFDMMIVDEFEKDGQRYIALIESVVGDNVMSDSYDFDETIMFCRILGDDGKEAFEPVENRATIAKLEDVLEERLFKRQNN